MPRRPCRRYIALAPTDLELQRINFQIMQTRPVRPAEMQKQADDLLAKYPADPRFKIVKAWAYFYTRNRLATPEQSRDDFKQYRSLILDAAKADPAFGSIRENHDRASGWNVGIRRLPAIC